LGDLSGVLELLMPQLMLQHTFRFWGTSAHRTSQFFCLQDAQFLVEAALY
jgi:hypothetical protein